MTTIQQSRSKLAPTRKGAMVILGLFAFGALIVGGICLTPHSKAPPAPAGARWGVPAHRLRIVCYDMARQHPDHEPMIARIRELNPDFVLLQGVDEDDGVQIAEDLHLEKTVHPQLYQRSERLAGRKGIWGNLILGKLNMYEAGPLGGPRGGFGASAVPAVDQTKWLVANLRLSPGEAGAAEVEEFKSIWQAKGQPPMVAAVLCTDSAPPPNLNFLTPAFGEGSRWLYVSKDWKVIKTGAARSAGEGVVPLWMDVEAAEASLSVSRQ